MNRLKWLVILLAVSVTTYAQQFKIVEDTVLINAPDFISPISDFEMKWAAKYHGFYFCVFQDQQIYDHWIRKHRLLAISENGKEIKEVGLPEDFQRNYYGDLFVRHDTLYLSPYHLNKDQGGYYFDMDTWQWKPVEWISNILYEDDQYSVAYVDIGEWGKYTWFIDIKEYPNQYIMPGKLSRIIKKDNVYYFIRGSKVDTLVSLKGKTKRCDEGYTYEDASFDEFAFLDNLMLSGGLQVDTIPTLFRFTGRTNENDWWNDRIYDTLFADAFLTNGQIYYLMSSPKRTYIAQLEGGKLIKKLDLGHRYRFFRWHDCFRGRNPGPNQCFLQFKENKNSYGVLEIKDTLIHICHIIHNQDSLPHVGTDNIEPLLQFLLLHLDHLTLAQTDSVERSLQATCQGEFRALANRYYPDEYQTGEYERYIYYTVVNAKTTLSVDYCVHRNDSVVKGAFFEWLKTNNYNSNSRSSESMENVKKKYTEVYRILTRLTGKEPVKASGNSSGSIWTFRNITIELYENGRMVMFLKEK